MITDYQNEYFKFYQLFKGNYYKGVSILRGILNDPVLARELVTNKAAMFAIYTDCLRSNVDGMCVDALNASAYADEGLITYLNAIMEKSFVDIPTLVANDDMNTVITNLAAMNAVAASTAAMNAVAASSTAMNAVAASSTAMNAVVASTAAMNAVAASTTAMNAVIASSTAMNAVASSAAAMNSVLKSSNARTAIAGYSGLNSLYNTIMATISNTTYFSKKYDYIDSGSKCAIPNSGTDSTSTANQSIFLCKKAGAWSDGTQVTVSVKHLQTGVSSGGTTTTSGGGYSTDDMSTGGVPLTVVCIGGATIQESGDAYISGIFAYAI